MKEYDLGHANTLVVNKILDKCGNDAVFLYQPSSEIFTFNFFCKRRDLQSIRNPKEFLKYTNSKNVPVVGMKRGGGMMWHGRGQIILAPSINIRRLKLSALEYSRILEKTCIQTLASFKINGTHNHYRYGAQGVWCDDPEDGKKKKISFFGFRVSRGTAVHGCAINICPDLYPFSLIDPCNLPNIEVTSMKKILGVVPDVNQVAKTLLKNFLNNISKK